MHQIIGARSIICCNALDARSAWRADRLRINGIA